MRAAALVLLVSYFCSACFTYVPVSSTPSRPGEPVRVYLSRPQTVDLEEVTASNITRVDGEVAALDNGELVLSAFDLLSGSGAEYTAQGRTVRLSSDAIERVERKRFDWLRTGALVAVGIAAGVLFTQIEGGFAGDSRTSPPGTSK